MLIIVAMDKYFSTRTYTAELFTIALLMLLGASSMVAPASGVLTSALTRARADLLEVFGGCLWV